MRLVAVDAFSEENVTIVV